MEKENDRAHGMTAILQVNRVSFCAGNQCRGTSGGCLRHHGWNEVWHLCNTWSLWCNFHNKFGEAPKDYSNAWVFIYKHAVCKYKSLSVVLYHSLFMPLPQPCLSLNTKRRRMYGILIPAGRTPAASFICFNESEIYLKQVNFSKNDVSCFVHLNCLFLIIFVSPAHSGVGALLIAKFSEVWAAWEKENLPFIYSCWKDSK